MRIKWYYLIFIVFFINSISFAEWNHAETVFDFSGDDSVFVSGYGTVTGNWYKSSCPHGIVVDNEGKLWIAFYFTEGEELINNTGDTVLTRPLWCLNADGSVAFKIDIFDLPDGGKDTLCAQSNHNGTGRGISLDYAGNILYTSWKTLYRFDYRTGRCLSRFVSPENASLAECVQDAENGFIYIAHLVPSGRPVYLLYPDMELIGNAIESVDQITRTIEVKTDQNGTDLYYGTTWSGCGIIHYHSDDPEFEGFTVVDTIGNFDKYTVNDSNYYDVKLWVSSLDWKPDGNLLVGSLRQTWAGPLGSKWWIIDPETGEYLDSFGEPAPDPSGNYGRDYELIPGGVNGPRGGFFTDDNTVYTVDFYMNTVDRWTTYPTLEAEWSANLNICTNSSSDNYNVLGTSYNSTDDFDSNVDIPEPPPAASNYLQLCFTHDDWSAPINRLSTDIRYPIDLRYYKQEWDFSVFTDQVGALHTIELTNLAGVNWDVGIYISDIARGEIAQLNQYSSSFTFTPDVAGEYEFQIIFGRLYPPTNVERTFYSGWNLIGLPLNPIENTYSEIIGDDIINRGYFYSYNGDSDYSETEYVEMGRGYWFGLLSSESVQYLGDSVKTEVIVPLNPGNNLISNPYNFMIDKNHLNIEMSGITYSFSESVSNNFISEAIHHYYNGYDGSEGESYYPTDTLGIWEGAWLYALVDGLSLIFEPSVAAKSYTAINVLNSESAWTVDLDLTANWGVDYSNTLGMNSEASDQFDAEYDFPEPPTSPSGKYLTGYFRHDNWTELGPKYDKDIRSLKDNDETWEYTIKSSIKGNVQISWNIQNFPDYFELFLEDPITNTIVDMKSVSSYNFNYQDVTTFEIHKVIAGAVDEIGLIPKVYAISQNYPNPFNPVTTIKYQLPVESHVILSIFNLRGQLVETLVSKKQAAGFYQVNWDASGVGTGVYFYQIKADDFKSTNKMVLIK